MTSSLAIGTCVLLCAVSIASADDRTGLGEGALERSKLANFEDFRNVNVSELLGAPTLRFNFNILGDVSLRASAPAGDDVHTAFGLGQFAMLFNADLGSQIHALAETAVESDFQNEIGIDIERLYLRWSNNHWLVQAGRVHAPLDYWNVAFHHGSWIQPTISRPRVVEYEDKGGLLPVHALGLYGGFHTDLGTGVFNATIGIANGRGDNTDNLRLIDDSNDFKSILAEVHQVGLFGLPGLRIGAAFLYDRIAAAPAMVRPALPDRAIGEYIVSGHFTYLGDRLMLIGEGFGIFHTGAGRQWTTMSAFLYGGYRLGQRWTPYGRIEWLDSKGGVDPYFAPDPLAPAPSAAQVFVGVARIQPLVETILGLRVDVSEWSAIKAEYRLLALPDAPDSTVSAGFLNWSFGL